VAIQQARHANIVKFPNTPFHYRDKGLWLLGAWQPRPMADVNSKALARSGWDAIFNLIGFRNRILVMVNWAWDFLLYERAVRLILPSESCQKVHRRTSGKLEQTQEYSQSLHGRN
jgi:hypothetical protein